MCAMTRVKWALLAAQAVGFSSTSGPACPDQYRAYEKVHAANEWGRLHEVIIGRAGMIFPNQDTVAVWQALKILPGHDKQMAAACFGKRNFECCTGAEDPHFVPSLETCPVNPPASDSCCTYGKVATEAENFVKALKAEGIDVIRGDEMSVATLEGNWGKEVLGIQGAMSIFPRDIMQVVNNIVIQHMLGGSNRRGEIYMMTKRWRERFGQPGWQEAVNGVQVLSMPVRDFSEQNFGGCKKVIGCDDPRMTAINTNPEGGDYGLCVTTNIKPEQCPEEKYPHGCTCETPVYSKHDDINVEGGDILMFGKHILIGYSANPSMGSSLKGVEWYRRTLKALGLHKQVHAIPMHEKILHLDLVMAAPREGLIIIADLPWDEQDCKGCKAFLAPLPKFLDDYDKIHISGLAGMYMACNTLPVSPNHLMMANNSLAPNHIIAEINYAVAEVHKRGIKTTVIDMAYHGAFGGALRCSSHPIRRDEK